MLATPTNLHPENEFLAQVISGAQVLARKSGIGRTGSNITNDN